MSHVTYHIIPCIIIISVNTKVVSGTSKLHKSKSYFLFISLHFTKMPQVWGAHKSPGNLVRMWILFSSSGMGPEGCNSDQPPGLLILLIRKPHGRQTGRQHRVQAMNHLQVFLLIFLERNTWLALVESYWVPTMYQIQLITLTSVGGRYNFISILQVGKLRHKEVR